MKKVIIIICVFTASLNAFAQTCEQREAKMLTTMGGLSAGFMYNTYAAIGSICDGYAHSTYAVKETNDLLQSQEQLISNLLGQLNELLTGHMLKDKNDEDFMRSVVKTVQGLKNQALYFQDYMKNKSDLKKNAYDDQRKENWKEISKMMGLKDE